MLSEQDIARLSSALEDRLATLEESSAASEDSRKPVELDQQSVGRLSRLDAMQIQAMAAAQERRRNHERHEIHAALERVANGEYGMCLECGDDIALKRLAFNPAVTRCIECAGGAG